MFRTLAVCIISLICCVLNPAGAASVRACASEQNNPPFLFSSPTNGAQSGLVLDILRFALPQANSAPWSVSLLPWTRCLKMTELGENELIVNVPTAQINPQPYLISEPYAQVHSVYVYSPKKYPLGLKISNLEDLKRYRLCSVLGVRYDSYGIRSDKVDSGAKNLLALIKKTDIGYCDLFIEKQESLLAIAKIDPSIAQALQKLSQRALPEDEPLGLHFAISRKAANAPQLLRRINDAIAELQRQQKIGQWLKQYTGQDAHTAH